ncbi:DUF6130 family protein [Caulobacter sp.]|uniref:DUF6130 family protein n=1 Tax=Caulobacter sp. TaxID=78 RepID=UPI003BAF7950
MTTLTKTLAATVIGAALLTAAAVQTASAQPAASVFLPIANEPPPKLIVEPPIPARLAAGSVLIPYRTENFRILPIFGAGALDVSPRAGHLHVTVDNLPWHWADASDDQTVVVVGLPPGPHKILLELALPDHRVLSGQTVSFIVPATSGATGGHH